MGPPRKRQKLSANQPAEIVFDPSARNDYLTGFHKRKVARAEQAKEAAIKRARQEKIDERRQLREQKKADLEAHVKAIDQEFRKLNPDISSESEHDTGETNGVSAVPVIEDAEEEFVDEDKYTTVTVEAMGSDQEDEEEEIRPTTERQPESKTKSSLPKKKKKKFRYESKAERKETRMKQKAKNKKQMLARKGEK